MDLKAKRDQLIAAREERLGQINHINGQLTIIDELLAEEAAREDAAKLAQAAELLTPHEKPHGETVAISRREWEDVTSLDWIGVPPPPAQHGEAVS